MKGNWKIKPQVVWGGILVVTGISVFLRVPYVMPQINQIQQFSVTSSVIKFCFYFIGILLIGGGLKKLFKHF